MMVFCNKLTVAGLALAWLGICAFVAACGGGAVEGKRVDLRSVRELPESELSRLRAARVFFGHQSVGGDIMAGVEDLLRTEPRLRLRVVPLQDAGAASGPFFAHAKIGENGQPTGKTDAFVGVLEQDLRGRVDVAVHKYCFVDISTSTDVASLFAQ
jgi:hypothetical protein